MFCPHCGKSNLPNAAFCSQCGNSMSAFANAVPPIDQVTQNLDSAPFSSQKNQFEIPAGVRGWSWGGFVFGWFWAIFNQTWIGLLALLPGIGLIMHIVLGFKGREWAWQNNHWESVEHFNRVQRRWSFAALFLFVLVALLFYGIIFLLGHTSTDPIPVGPHSTSI
jgi:hypothetical protein